MDITESLRTNLEGAFLLPREAVDLLLMVFHVTQTFDDYADGDEVSRDDLNALIWDTMVAIPENRFYRMYSDKLVPVIATCILKWQGSDMAERNGQAGAMAYSWRAGFYDLVLFVFSLVHGPTVAIQNSLTIMSLYGESFEDYMKEFDNA